MDTQKYSGLFLEVDMEARHLTGTTP